MRQDPSVGDTPRLPASFERDDDSAYAHPDAIPASRRMTLRHPFAHAAANECASAARRRTDDEPVTDLSPTFPAPRVSCLHPSTILLIHQVNED